MVSRHKDTVGFAGSFPCADETGCYTKRDAELGHCHCHDTL